jgi:hypothetical protein
LNAAASRWAQREGALGHAGIERLNQKLDLLLVESEFGTDATAAVVHAINAFAAEQRVGRA